MSWFKSLFSLLCFSLSLCSYAVESDPSSATLKLIPLETSYAKGQSITLRVELALPDPWHTYGDPSGDVGAPPVFTWDLPKGITVEKIDWPNPTLYKKHGLQTYEYHGLVFWTVHLKADSKVKEGNYPIDLQLSWIACNDMCVPQKHHAETMITLGQVPTMAQAPEAEPGLMETMASKSLWNFILLGFIGGLILNVMPCVLPVIGLKMVNLISSSKHTYKQSLLSSFSYTFGVLLMFWILTIFLFFLQRANTAFGWGFQLQNPYFVIFLILLFVLISANLFGLFHFGTRVASWAQEKEEQFKERLGSEHLYLKSFSSGLLATCVATPCTGPLLGAVIGFASLLTLPKALILFTSIALGMASPFILIALIPPLAWLLPKPGKWMETFMQLLGFLLLFSAIWLTWVLSRIAPAFVFEWFLVGVLVLFVSTFLFGKSQQHSGFIVSKVLFFLSFIAFIFGCFFSIASVNPTLRKSFHTLVWGRQLTWEPYSERKLLQEIDAGTIVLVDVSARWCLTCQVNSLAFANESLQNYLSQNKIVLMEADWTKYDPEVTRLLRSLNRNGVPTLALFVKGKTPILLPELITPDIVKDGIEDIKK